MSDGKGACAFTRPSLNTIGKPLFKVSCVLVGAIFGFRYVLISVAPVSFVERGLHQGELTALANGINSLDPQRIEPIGQRATRCGLCVRKGKRLLLDADGRLARSNSLERAIATRTRKVVETVDRCEHLFRRQSQELVDDPVHLLLQGNHVLAKHVCLFPTAYHVLMQFAGGGCTRNRSGQACRTRYVDHPAPVAID